MPCDKCKTPLMSLLHQRRFSVSAKWQSHFVEFTFFTVSKTDGREKG